MFDSEDKSYVDCFLRFVLLLLVLLLLKIRRRMHISLTPVRMTLGRICPLWRLRRGSHKVSIFRGLWRGGEVGVVAAHLIHRLLDRLGEVEGLVPLVGGPPHSRQVSWGRRQHHHAGFDRRGLMLHLLGRRRHSRRRKGVC